MFGLFMLWMLGRNNDLLEQIRLNQLSKAQRTTEDATRHNQERAHTIAMLGVIVAIILSPVLIGLVLFITHLVEAILNWLPL
jgi:uncharacterized membrane protein